VAKSKKPPMMKAKKKKCDCGGCPKCKKKKMAMKR
jgi:hypothetical protein